MVRESARSRAGTSASFPKSCRRAPGGWDCGTRSSVARAVEEFRMRSRSRACLAVLPALWLCVLASLPIAAQGGGSGNIGDPRMDAVGRDPGCVAQTLVSAGGPAPRDPQTLAIRWVGYSN